MEVDITSLVERLQSEVEQNTNDASFVMALVAVHIAHGKPELAIDLLNRRKELFVGEHEHLWSIWAAKSFIQTKDFAAVESCLESISDERRRQLWQFGLLIEMGNEAGLTEFLQQDFSENPLLVLNVSQTRAFQKDWSLAARYASVLVEKINTSIAFELAVEGLFQEGEYSQCVQLIQDIGEYYKPEDLPWQYQNKRLRCLIELGNLREAYIDGETLYAKTPNVETFITLGMIYQRAGDLDKIAFIARDLLEKIEIPVMDLLVTAQFTILKDLKLAIVLWRQAMERGVPDEALTSALLLANSLGTKSETEPLFLQMQKIIQAGENQGFWMMTFEERVKQIQNTREFNVDVAESYKKGDAPISVAAHFLSSPLSWFYHQRLTLAEDNNWLSSDTALMARHGSRPVFTQINREALVGHLALDITSILLLRHFRLLTKIEEYYSPIYLPQSLILELSSMLLEHQRQDRQLLQACEEIIVLADTGKLALINLAPLHNGEDENLIAQMGSEWLEQYRYAETHNAYFVNFLPALRRGLELQAADLPTNAQEILIDVPALVSCLREHKLLTPEEFEQTRFDMGNSSQSKTNLKPQANKQLIFYANTLEYAAGLGILKKLSKLFRIYVTEAQLHDARTIVRGEGSIHEQREWIADLIRDLHQGILTGVYEVLPRYHQEADEELPEDLAANSIASLIQQRQEIGDIIITDERFFNGLIQVNKARVLCSLDLLRALHEHGSVSRVLCK